MKHLAILFIFLVGCATSSGVVPTGPDSFMVSRSAPWGSANASTVLADCYQEANEFCAKDGKKMETVHTQTTPLYFGHRPEAQLDFMCLKEGDPQLTRVKMVRDPDSIVEIRKNGGDRAPASQK